MEMDKFPFGAAVNFGWRKVKENFWSLVIITIIWVAIVGILNSSAKNLEKTMPVISFLLSLCATLVNMVITMGVTRIGLKIYAGEKFSIAGMFYCGGEQALNYFVASILYFLAVLAGLILLIVPGIIVMIRMGLYLYLIVDKKMGIIDSLKESMKLTKGNAFNLFLFWLLLLGVILLGFLALFVGILVAIPVTILAYVFVYRYLESRKQPAFAQQS
ncbi:MAG: hypothetical protein PHT50_03185 [Candidatus Omnitrophica bacterium]|nr:hypothetical protein [Candidatus Omnitrophota bacterium]